MFRNLSNLDMNVYFLMYLFAKKSFILNGITLNKNKNIIQVFSHYFIGILARRIIEKVQYFDLGKNTTVDMIVS